MSGSRIFRLAIILTFIVILTATAMVVGAKTSNAQVPTTGSDWQQVPNVAADIDFRDVFMSDVNSGIAVGKQGDRGVAFELRWTAVDGSRSALQMIPVG